ncbi:hypothetical protein Hanom_Chr04g00374831 [Helianthus anomalus]
MSTPESHVRRARLSCRHRRAMCGGPVCHIDAGEPCVARPPCREPCAARPPCRSRRPPSLSLIFSPLSFSPDGLLCGLGFGFEERRRGRWLVLVAEGYTESNVIDAMKFVFGKKESKQGNGLFDFDKSWI